MPASSIWQKVGAELGITTLLHSSRDVHLLLLTRAFRMVAYGSSTLILALYFSALGHSDTKIGLFMTLTLVGDVMISLALTLVSDSLGRRRILLLGSALMSASGIVFAVTSNYWILLFAAVVGVISPSGNEIGPFRAIEESTLAHLSDAKGRSDVFAWYVVVGTLGTAGGSLGCGWLVQGLMNKGWTDVAAYRVVFWLYTLIGIIKGGITLLLSSRCEVDPTPEPGPAEPADDEENEAFLDTADGQPQASKASKPPPAKAKKGWAITQISPKSRLTLLKLCALFFVDSLASGMVPMSLIAFYMERRFGMPQSSLGTIVSIAAFMSSLGNIFASSVSKRIGLIKTMVFTHLPSAIFLALIPAPRILALTIVLLVARATLSSMDQAPRTAFLAAVVLPSERTAVMGIVNTVKTMSQSSGPLITGVLAGKDKFWIAFLVAGALKASYDVGMLVIFVNTKLEDGSEPIRGSAGPAVELQDRPRSEDRFEDGNEDEDDFALGSEAEDSDADDRGGAKRMPL